MAWNEKKKTKEEIDYIHVSYIYIYTDTEVGAQ